MTSAFRPITNRFVAGLLFDDHGDMIALQKTPFFWDEPASWFTISGRVMGPTEEPTVAMDRVFHEKTGKRTRWRPAAIVHGADFLIHYFSCRDTDLIYGVSQPEAGGVVRFPTIYVRSSNRPGLPDLKVIASIALDDSIKFEKPVILMSKQRFMPVETKRPGPKGKWDGIYQEIASMEVGQALIAPSALDSSFANSVRGHVRRYMPEKKFEITQVGGGNQRQIKRVL